MIFPMRLYNKDGDLVKTLSSETLSKNHWNKFLGNENSNFWDKREKKAKVGKTKEFIEAA